MIQPAGKPKSGIFLVLGIFLIGIVMVWSLFYAAHVLRGPTTRDSSSEAR